MSGYRSKRVANTRTAMGTTDQRPTGSGAVMLGLTGSGPGSSPWARRAAQRRAYTSMLQKKCAEGDKASCINPVAAVANCVSTGILVSQDDIDITWSINSKDGVNENYIKASIRFKNNCGPVNISSPDDSAENLLISQFKLTGDISNVLHVDAGTDGVLSMYDWIPNYPGAEGSAIYNLVGSGVDEGKIELFWDASGNSEYFDGNPTDATTLTLTYTKVEHHHHAHLQATEEYVPDFTDIDTNAFNVV